MNWLHYLLEANLYMAVFYGCYWLLLRNQTFYNANRAYLIITTMLSFIIPVLQLGALKQPIDKGNTITTIVLAQPGQQAAVQQFTINWDMVIYIGYCVVAIVLVTLFLVKMFSLLKLARQGQRTEKEQYVLIKLQQQHTAFSFFRYLFVSADQEVSQVIIHHELVHIRQKHSLDIVLFELLKIINWFNPFIYLAQRSLKELHEFIADEQTTVNNTDTESYARFLIDSAYGVSGMALANSFFNKNLLKTRIMKLYQKPSGSLARLNYLIAMPVCAGLLCVSTLGFSKSYGWVDLTPQQQDTITKIKVQPTVKEVKLAPPPPPPVALRVKPSKKATVKFPEPKVEVVKFPAPKVAKVSKSVPPPPPPITVESIEKKESVAYLAAERTKNSKDGDKVVELKLLPTKIDKNDWSGLMQHLARTIRYPQVARANETAGAVLIEFTLNADHKISNASVKKSLSTELDAEVLRAVKAYGSSINHEAGTYKAVVNYVLETKANKQLKGEGIQKSLTEGGNYIGEIVVVGYLDK